MPGSCLYGLLRETSRSSGTTCHTRLASRSTYATVPKSTFHKYLRVACRLFSKGEHHGGEQIAPVTLFTTRRCAYAASTSQRQSPARLPCLHSALVRSRPPRERPRGRHRCAPRSLVRNCCPAPLGEQRRHSVSLEAINLGVASRRLHVRTLLLEKLLVWCSCLSECRHGARLLRKPAYHALAVKVYHNCASTQPHNIVSA